MVKREVKGNKVSWVLENKRDLGTEITFGYQAALYDADKIDIGPIKDVKPQLASPAVVNDRGKLMVAGHYPTQPSQVRFKLEYANERSCWKLTGIAVSVGGE